MSDIDFDELDKAVSSLMQTREQSMQPATSDEAEESANTPAAQSVTADETSDNDTADPSGPSTDSATPVVSTSTRAEQPNSGARPVADRPNLVTKRRGQFMDVIHPSKDSKPESTNLRVPSRLGISLEPLGSNPDDADDSRPAQPAPGVDVIGARASIEPTPLSSVSEEADADSSSSEVTEEKVWPDPLEVNGADRLSEAADADDSPSASVQPSSLTDSPFLADAKVEKRPLGVAEVADDSPELSELAKIAEEIEEEEAHQPEQSSEVAAEITPSVEIETEPDTESNVEAKDSANEQLVTDNPALKDALAADDSLSQELDDSLNTIEGHDTGAAARAASDADEVASDTGEASVVAPGTILASPDTPQAVTTASALPSRTPTTALDAADDDSSTSIFDTTEHDGIKPAPKHSSRWYTVMIFLGMAVLGVLGGVFVFYFMISN